MVEATAKHWRRLAVVFGGTQNDNHVRRTCFFLLGLIAYSERQPKHLKGPKEKNYQGSDTKKFFQRTRI